MYIIWRLVFSFSAASHTLLSLINTSVYYVLCVAYKINTISFQKIKAHYEKRYESPSRDL